MSRRIQSRFFAFDEMTFPTKLSTRTLVIKITRFANIIIVGFDLAISEVGDIAIGVLNVGYFVKAALWLKTHSNSNGK
jgi:hypothetical protein